MHGRLIILLAGLLALLPLRLHAQGFPLTPITGARVPCVNGMASHFPCLDVDLMSYLPIPSLGGARNDNNPSSSAAVVATTWGWTDGLTRREYALVARSDGTAFVDVTDAVNPVYVGFLPRPALQVQTTNATPVQPSSWRELKTLGDFMYVVSEASGHGLQIFDLKELRRFAGTPLTFAETARYAGIGRAHNVAVSERGFAIATGMSGPQTGVGCGPGMHFVNVSNPASPTFAGCFNSSVHRGYSHDVQCVVYRGPDTRYTGREICIGSDERALSIVDVTDKPSFVQIATGTYPNPVYTHQGWLSEDHRYFFVDDEIDETSGVATRTRTLVFDMQRLDDPLFINAHLGTTTATDHNQYVRGHYTFQANYTSGLRILDITTPTNLREVAFFDTYPAHNNAGYVGVWNVYPYFESGNVVAGNIGEGLFVVRPTRLSLGTEEPETPETFGFALTSENPFRSRVSFRLDLPEAASVHVAVYDVLGREISTLLDRTLAPGTHGLSFDGNALPSSLYFVRARTGDAVRTLAVTLVR